MLSVAEMTFGVKEWLMKMTKMYFYKIGCASLNERLAIFRVTTNNKRETSAVNELNKDQVMYRNTYSTYPKTQVNKSLI